MSVSFEISAFSSNPKALIGVLSGLSRVNQWPFDHNREVEEIVCKTPSSALNYCRHVVHAYGVSPKGERVFLKNPKLGIRYLRLTNKPRFSDDDTQKRFWRKVIRNPDIAYTWATTFNKRLSEEEEMVFSESIRIAWQYANRIIRGAFPESVHHRILLRSFENLDQYSKQALNNYLAFASTHGAAILEGSAPVGNR